MFAIERFISQNIPRVKLENFDYRYTALFEEGKPGQRGRFPRQSPRRCASTAAIISPPAAGGGRAGSILWGPGAPVSDRLIAGHWVAQRSL